MGCKESKQGGGGDGPGPTGATGGLPSLDLSGLDGATKFEYLMPFSKTKIEVFAKKVRDASSDGAITIEQIRIAFKEDKAWSEALVKDDGLLI